MARLGWTFAPLAARLHLPCDGGRWRREPADRTQRPIPRPGQTTRGQWWRRSLDRLLVQGEEIAGRVEKPGGQLAGVAADSLHHLLTSVLDGGNGIGQIVDVDADQDTRGAVGGSPDAPSRVDRAGLSIVEGQRAVAASAGSPAEDLLVEGC